MIQSFEVGQLFLLCLLCLMAIYCFANQQSHRRSQKRLALPLSVHRQWWGHPVHQTPPVYYLFLKIYVHGDVKSHFPVVLLCRCCEM